jgi:NAD(P)-dependent dehydrogenase (short-subunit alcohol dehydrogenase family)
MGRAGELEATLLLLASDSSSYITGQNFVVDGGFSVW